MRILDKMEFQKSSFFPFLVIAFVIACVFGEDSSQFFTLENYEGTYSELKSCDLSHPNLFEREISDPDTKTYKPSPFDIFCSPQSSATGNQLRLYMCRTYYEVVKLFFDCNALTTKKMTQYQLFSRENINANGQLACQVLSTIFLNPQNNRPIMEKDTCSTLCEVSPLFCNDFAFIYKIYYNQSVMNAKANGNLNAGPDGDTRADQNVDEDKDTTVNQLGEGDAEGDPPVAQGEQHDESDDGKRGKEDIARNNGVEDPADVAALGAGNDIPPKDTPPNIPPGDGSSLLNVLKSAGKTPPADPTGGNMDTLSATGTNPGADDDPKSGNDSHTVSIPKSNPDDGRGDSGAQSGKEDPLQPDGDKTETMENEGDNQDIKDNNQTPEGAEESQNDNAGTLDSGGNKEAEGREHTNQEIVEPKEELERQGEQGRTPEVTEDKPDSTEVDNQDSQKEDSFDDGKREDQDNGDVEGSDNGKGENQDRQVPEDPDSGDGGNQDNMEGDEEEEEAQEPQKSPNEAVQDQSGESYSEAVEPEDENDQKQDWSDAESDESSILSSDYKEPSQESSYEDSESSYDSSDFSNDDSHFEFEMPRPDNGKVEIPSGGSRAEVPGDGSKVGNLALENKGGISSSNIQQEYDSIDGESSHFLAYSLTAIILIMGTYILYHNKQKIIAIVIEGKTGRNGGRRRRLNQNVSEVMPSLTGTKLEV